MRLDNKVALVTGAASAIRARFLMKVISAAGRCSGGTLPARQWT